MAVDKEMQALIDAPLADPLKLYLPKGTKIQRRGPRHAHVDNIGAEKLTKAQLDKRRGNLADAKMGAVLDYYATTDVPIDRIAAHTGLTLERATEAMKYRGRS